MSDWCDSEAEINRLQAENDRLRTELANATEGRYAAWEIERASLQAEITTLKTQWDRGALVARAEVAESILAKLKTAFPDEPDEDTDPTSCIDCNTTVEWRDEDEKGLHICDECAQEILATVKLIMGEKG